MAERRIPQAARFPLLLALHDEYIKIAPAMVCNLVGSYQCCEISTGSTSKPSSHSYLITEQKKLLISIAHSSSRISLLQIVVQ